MKRWIVRIIAGLVLAGAILLGNAGLMGDSAGARSESGAAERPTAWQSMADGEVIIEPTTDAESRRIRVRIADEASERAQGMQHLPPEVIRATPIWFEFPVPRRTSWHMRNVRAALDIAYVDDNGRVIGIERMTPGGSGYGSDAAIAAALELAAGEAERLGIQVGTRLRRAR